MRKPGGISTGVMLAAVLVAGCNNEPPQRPDEIPLVRVLKVDASVGQSAVEFPGEVRPRHETSLSFLVGGKLIERPVVAGMQVRKGAVLARIDASDLQLAVKAAESQLASARAERELAAADLKRFRDLWERKFISTAEFERRSTTVDTLQSRVDAAESMLRQARNQFEYASLVAYADGVVMGTDAEVGQVVAPGQPVLRLARLGEKEVLIAVPESQHRVIARASAFAVRLNAVPEREWRGRLRELAPAADPVTRTYAARITLLEAGADVVLGMSARVALLSEARPGYQLPVKAIHSRGDGNKVWVVEAGAVRAAPVVLRDVGADNVVVESGLNPGDVVVVAGTQLLRAGQRVRILQDDPKR